MMKKRASQWRLFFLFAFTPTPDDEPQGHHGAGHDDPYVLRLAPMLRVFNDADVAQIIEGDGRAVVDEMHQNAGPERAGEIEHVAQQDA